MSDSVVYVPPPQPHRCNVGWTSQERSLPPPLVPPAPGWVAATRERVWLQLDAVGTVRRCDECGRYWRAVRADDFPVGSRLRRVEWEQEGRLRRWWRTRKEHTDG